MSDFFETTLVIRTEEEVSPHYIAMRVAQACGQFHALRLGESVYAVDDPEEREYVICNAADENLGLHTLGEIGRKARR